MWPKTRNVYSTTLIGQFLDMPVHSDKQKEGSLGLHSLADEITKSHPGAVSMKIIAITDK